MIPVWVSVVGVVLGGLFSMYSCYWLARWIGKWRPYTSFRESYYPQFHLKNTQTIGVDRAGMIHGKSSFPFTLVNTVTQERHEAEWRTYIDYEGDHGPKGRVLSHCVLEYTPIGAGQPFAVENQNAADLTVTLYTIGETWVQGRYSNLPDTLDEETERGWNIAAGGCLVWMMVFGCGGMGLWMMLAS